MKCKSRSLSHYYSWAKYACGNETVDTPLDIFTFLHRTVSLIDRASILSSLDIHSLKQRMGEEFQDVLFYNKSFLSDISCDISKMSCLGAEIVFYVFCFFELFCVWSDRETAGAELGNMICCGLAPWRN